MNTQTLSDIDRICNEVYAFLKDRKRGKNHFSKKTIDEILLEVGRDSRWRVEARILILMYLEKYCLTVSQEKRVYSLLARNIASCTVRRHGDFIEFLVLRSLNLNILAMCWVMRGKWGFENDKEALSYQWRRLEKLKVEHFFLKRFQRKFRLVSHRSRSIRVAA
jgi:hypothetical protein